MDGARGLAYRELSTRGPHAAIKIRRARRPAHLEWETKDLSRSVADPAFVLLGAACESRRGSDCVDGGVACVLVGLVRILKGE